MKSVCVNHPDTKATALCALCSKPVCPRCIVERNAHFYCSEECAGNAGKATLEQAKADAQNYGIEFSEDYTVLEHFPSNCKLTSYQIPACVTAIGDGAFEDCSNLLSSITFGNNIIAIGKGAFIPTERIVLDKENQNFMIKDDALIEKRTQRLIHYFGQDENYHVPEGVTVIGDWAFRGSEELSSITLPAGVTTIGDSAFSDCKNLSRITLPDGVTAIGNWAFYFCVNLKRITLPATIRAIHPDAFYCAGCEDYVKQNYGHLMKE